MIAASVAKNFGTNTTQKDFFTIPHNYNILNPNNDMIIQDNFQFDDDEFKEYSNKSYIKSRASSKYLSEKSEEIKDLDRKNKQMKMNGLGNISKYLFTYGKENEKDSNFYIIKKLEFLYSKKVINTTIQLILCIVSIMCAIVSYELDYLGYNNNIALWFCFINSIFLWFTLVFEYHINSQILSITKNIPLKLWIWEFNNIKSTIILILVFFLHPNPVFNGIIVSIYNERTEKYYNHSLNSIMTAICLTRIMFVLKFYLNISKYYSPRGQRVSRMNNFDADLEYTLKACFHKRPITSYTLIFMIILGYTSYCFRMFERVADDDTGLFFGNYWNCLWCLVITMTTVGYGDKYPTTLLTRIVGIIACVFGICLISMLVVTITNVVVFTPIELNVFLILQRVDLKEEKDFLATKLIIKYYEYIKKLKNRKLVLGLNKKSKLRDELMIDLFNFNSKLAELDSTFPAYSKYDNLVDILHLLMDDKRLNKIEQNYADMDLMLRDIKKKMDK